MEESRSRIYVVGTGGAGNNTVSRLTKIGIEGAKPLLLTLMPKIYIIVSLTRKF